MLAMGALPSGAVFVFATWCMPETPRWLVMKDRMDEAKLVIECVNKKTANAGKIANAANEAAELPNSREDDTDAQNGTSSENGGKKGTDDIVTAVLTNIQESLANERKVSNSECCGWGKIFKPTPATRLTLAVGIMVAIMQQISGIETVMVGVGVYMRERVCRYVCAKISKIIFRFSKTHKSHTFSHHFIKTLVLISQYYQPQILKDAGIRESKTQLLITFATGSVKLVMIFLAGFLVDNVGGRRSLLMASHAGCMVALFMVSEWVSE